MDFSDFWQAYPRRVAKREAEKAWAKIALSEHQAVLDGLARYIAYEWQGREMCFIPHAASWLRGRRWEDELIPIRRARESDAGRNTAQDSLDAWRARNGRAN